MNMTKKVNFWQSEQENNITDDGRGITSNIYMQKKSAINIKGPKNQFETNAFAIIQKSNQDSINQQGGLY